MVTYGNKQQGEEWISNLNGPNYSDELQMATLTSLAPHMPSRRIASLDFSRSESGSAMVKYSHRTVTTAL